MNRSPAATAPETLEAGRGAATAAVIAIVGELAVAVVDAGVLGPGPLVVTRVAHVAIAAVALAWLFARPPSIRAAEIAFAFVAVPFQVVLAVSEAEFAGRGGVRDHGSWYKLVMVGIAALAPADPVFPSVLVVALGVQKVVLQFVLGRPPVAPGEPWVTLIFAAIAVAMLVSRARRRRAIAHAAKIAAHAAALERMARLLLRVRDRANTPLQTIALGSALLTRRCAGQERVAAAMERAVRRLSRLSKALQRASRSIERT